MPYLSDDRPQKPFNVFDCVDEINEVTAQSKFNSNLLRRVQCKVKTLSEFWNLTEAQTIMFCAICENGIGCSITLTNLADYFGCSRVKLLSYLNDIEQLKEKHLIRKYPAVGRKKEESYYIPSDVLTAFANNKGYVYHKPHFQSNDEFLDSMDKNYSNLQEAIIDTEDYYLNLNELIEENEHLQIVKHITSCANHLNEVEYKLFLFFVVATYHGGYDAAFLPENWDDIKDHSNPFPWKQLIRSMVDGTSALITSGLIGHPFSNGTTEKDLFCLEKDIKKELFGAGMEKYLQTKKQKQLKKLIDSSTLVSKELFYNPKNRDDVALLDELLEPKKLNEMQRRLKEDGHRIGIAIALYGAPGVGKTELVFQLAKKHGRKIYKVDLSAIQSKWVGESEENTRKIFTDYKYYCESCLNLNEPLPILFINEADGLFCKRIANVDNSVDQMRNTMQNIILEEMEQLDGIMFATTNMMNNFDDAILRRFLFSINFERPNIETAAKIYHSMLPMLAETDARILAREFPLLTGGNIENVKRKATIENVIHNTKIDLETLRDLCSKESVPHAIAKIGF